MKPHLNFFFVFAQHFANIFTPHDDAKDHETERNLTAPINSHQTVMYTSPKEIKEVIKSLGLKNAPGLDQVTILNVYLKFTWNKVFMGK
jgi:hypothetical protein